MLLFDVDNDNYQLCGRFFVIHNSMKRKHEEEKENGAAKHHRVHELYARSLELFGFRAIQLPTHFKHLIDIIRTQNNAGDEKSPLCDVPAVRDCLSDLAIDVAIDDMHCKRVRELEVQCVQQAPNVAIFDVHLKQFLLFNGRSFKILPTPPLHMKPWKKCIVDRMVLSDEYCSDWIGGWVYRCVLVLSMTNQQQLVRFNPPSTDALIFDLQTMTWSPAAAIVSKVTMPRKYNAAISLCRHGLVMSGGGYEPFDWDVLPAVKPPIDNFHPTHAMEMFISSADDDGNLKQLPAMPRARMNHAMLCTDQFAIVAGGFHGAYGPLNSVDVFDFASQTWTSWPPMKQPRGHSCVLVQINSKIFAVGGDDDNDTSIETVEQFSVAEWEWKLVTTKCQARTQCARVPRWSGITACECEDIPSVDDSFERIVHKTNLFVPTE